MANLLLAGRNDQRPNESPLNKAKNENQFSRGKSFVKSPDSVSRLSI